MLKTVLTDLENGNDLSREKALELVSLYSWEELSVISEPLRQKTSGNRILLCTIINAKSGSCDMDCKFCSQSALSRCNVHTYPLVPFGDIESFLAASLKSGAGNGGIVTSGGKLGVSDTDRLAGDLSILNKKYPIGICGSLGRLDDQELMKLKKAGMTRIHHNLESSENYYKKICTTQSWESRLNTVKQALSIGFDVCCGGLFGMGESWEDRIELALTLRDLGIKSVPLNFLHPHKGTEFSSLNKLSPEEALKIITIYRLLLPDSVLRICGGRVSILGEKQKHIFRAGANAMMTGNYLTTSGAVPEEDILMIRNQGLEVQQ